MYLICDLWTKQPAGTSWTDGPGVHIFWVGPNQIAECSLVWNLLIPLNGANLVQGLDVRRKSSVHAEDLLVYQLKSGTQAKLTHDHRKRVASSWTWVLKGLRFTSTPESTTITNNWKHFKLTAATVSMSKTLVQYRQALALPYLVWHSSEGEQNTLRA